MPKDKNFKRLVRDRMRETGERYAEARAKLRDDNPGGGSGEQLRGVLEFPGGRTLGALYITNTTTRSARRLEGAGRVEIATTERVMLRVYPQLDLRLPTRDELQANPKLMDDVVSSLPALLAASPRPDFAVLEELDETLIDILEFDTVGTPQEIPGLLRFRSLDTLSLRLIEPFTDGDFSPLVSMSWLDHLLILNATTTDGLLQHLPLDSLVSLGLPRCGITDDGARNLARLANLEAINLAETKITDDGAQALLALPNLVELQLAGTAITDATVRAIAERNPPLPRVGLKGCEDVTESSIEALRTTNPAVTLMPSFSAPLGSGGRVDGASNAWP